MNNIIIVLCVVVSAFSFSPAEIKSFVLQQPLVQNCQVAQSEDSLIVACITKPIFKRSDRVAFETALIIKLKETFGMKEVFISYDLKVFYEFSKIEQKTDKEKCSYLENLLQSFRNRNAITSR